MLNKVFNVNDLFVPALLETLIYRILLVVLNNNYFHIYEKTTKYIYNTLIIYEISYKLYILKIQIEINNT